MREPSSPSSVASAASMRGCAEPGGDTCSCASPTGIDATCSEHGFPESPSPMTFVKSQKAHSPDDCERWEEAETANTLSPRDGTATTTLVLSPAESPARTGRSPGNEPESKAIGPGSSSSSPASLTLFDPLGCSSRMSPDSSPLARVRDAETAAEFFLAIAEPTSPWSSPVWRTSGTAWRGGYSTVASSECRSAAGECSSSEPALTEILEPPQSVPGKYSLSGRAARGILARARKRGRTLPAALEASLQAVAGASAQTRQP